MSDGVRVRVCGALRLEIGGEAREERLRGRQGRLLLAFLVLHRHRPVRRDELVEALWAQEGRPPSETALAPVLSRLRAAIAPLALTGREALRLELGDGAWVDLEAARDAVRRARAAGGEAAVAAAREAADLLEPGLLPDLDAPWLAEVRDEAADLRTEALELLARAATATDPAAAERAARAAVAAAPFRESARAALIEVLRSRGNVAEALLAYEELRTLLRDELGAVPGPELVALHERLLAQDAPAPAPAPPAAPAPRAPAAPAGAGTLVERDRELREVDAALDRLAAGAGGVLLLEGPAGIGKTRMLGELRARARARVLEARAGVLERDYAFGVVRQLLEEAAAAPGAFEGPAASARGVLVDGAATEGSFALLHGLFHLTSRIAAEGPVLLCVDDLQWSDPASLRFVAYLARRIGDLPVLLAATVRTGEPGVDEALLGEVAADPLAVVLRPAPLSAAASAVVVRDVLGDAVNPAFAASCHEVTAGNPLLLRQLVTALAAEGVVPDAGHAEEVRAIGPRAVARTVLLRLARLPEPAVGVARAVAVLGEQPALGMVAALAGTDEGTAADAVDALARAEILRDREPLGFVHPLVRDAVYGELSAARRGLEHGRAARLLEERGADVERVAAQLLQTPPRADAWAVGRLRVASEQALRRGAPDSAMAYLQRAQSEPPSDDVQPALGLELGRVSLLVNGAAAIEPLRLAFARLTDPAGRARAALELSRLLMFVNAADEGAAVAKRTIAELPPGHEDLEAGLRAVVAVSVFFGASDPSELERLAEWRAGPRGQGPGAKSLTSIASLALALACGDAEEAAALARESMADDVIFEWDPGVFCVGSGQVLALLEPAEGMALFDHMRRFAHRRGSVLDVVGADLWGGLVLQWAGELVEATACAERAWEGERFWGTSSAEVMGYSSAFLSAAWLARGDLDRAERALARVTVQRGQSDGGRFWLASRSRVLLEQGRAAEVLPLTEHLAKTRPPDFHPLWGPWRELRARALAALGDRDGAVALAREELELARRTGARWVIGRGLSLLGAQLEGDAALEHAREAVALLDPTSARLERALAHSRLGDALTALGRGDDAERARGTALALARACGADGLAAALETALADRSGRRVGR